MKPERLVFPDLDYPLETLIHHKNRYEFVKQFVKKDDIIYDLGCGTGYGSNMLSDICNNVYGIDKSEKAIHYAITHYKNPTFIINNINDVVIPNINIVTMFECLEHLTDGEGVRILSEISRNTKYLFLSIPTDSELEYNKYHRSQWNDEDLKTVLEGLFDRVIMFGQDWASGQIHYPYSKQHSITFVMCINE